MLILFLRIQTRLSSLSSLWRVQDPAQDLWEFQGLRDKELVSYQNSCCLLCDLQLYLGSHPRHRPFCISPRSVPRGTGTDGHLGLEADLLLYVSCLSEGVTAQQILHPPSQRSFHLPAATSSIFFTQHQGLAWRLNTSPLAVSTLHGWSRLGRQALPSSLPPQWCLGELLIHNICN